MLKKKLDIGVVTDASESLKGNSDNINGALKNMIRSIKTSEDLHGYEVFFTIIPFSSKIDEKNAIEFQPIDKVRADAINLEFAGQTNPGPAIEKFIDKAMARYEEWKENSVECCHPQLFFFTDGNPYPFEKYHAPYVAAAEKVKAYEANKKLFVAGAGFGAANLDNIRLLTNHPNRVLKINGTNVDKLTEFFREIIPMTIVHSVTEEIDAIDRMFGAFTDE